jgi:hypothetical protein
MTATGPIETSLDVAKIYNSDGKTCRMEREGAAVDIRNKGALQRMRSIVHIGGVRLLSIGGLLPATSNGIFGTHLGI